MNDDRLVKILTPWERRHPRLFASLRAGGGVTLLIVSVILLAYHVWWGVLLWPVAALCFYASYRKPSSNPRNDEVDRREVTALAPVLPGGADRA
jgi:hypothetical protein